MPEGDGADITHLNVLRYSDDLTAEDVHGLWEFLLDRTEDLLQHPHAEVQRAAEAIRNAGRLPHAMLTMSLGERDKAGRLLEPVSHALHDYWYQLWQLAAPWAGTPGFNASRWRELPARNPADEREKERLKALALEQNPDLGL